MSDGDGLYAVRCGTFCGFARRMLKRVRQTVAQRMMRRRRRSYGTVQVKVGPLTLDCQAEPSKLDAE